MSLELAGLKRQRAECAQAMRAICDLTEKESRGFNDDERSKWNGHREDIDKLDVRIADLEDMVALEARLSDDTMNALPGESRSFEQGSDGRPQYLEGKGGGDDDEDDGGDAAYRDAFSSMLRCTEPGLATLSAEQRSVLTAGRVQVRAGAVGTPTAGGYLVPETMGGRIVETMKAYGGIRQFANVISTSAGEAINFPTNDDTDNKAEIVDENQDVGETDFIFGQVSIGAYKYSSKVVRISMELLQDSAFGVENFIAVQFGKRFGRGTSAHYATGTGTKQPHGLATDAQSGHTSASGTKVVYKDLLGLKHSVDPAYRGAARWVFNDKTLLMLKEQEDGQGRPLWKPAVSGDAPDLIDGDPYVIDQGMPEPAAGATSVAYGDLSEFLIRDVLGFQLMRLFERYAEFGQVGFVGFMRTDSALMDKAAVKVLTMAGAARASA